MMISSVVPKTKKKEKKKTNISPSIYLHLFILTYINIRIPHRPQLMLGVSLVIKPLGSALSSPSSLQASSNASFIVYLAATSRNCLTANPSTCGVRSRYIDLLMVWKKQIPIPATTSLRQHCGADGRVQTLPKSPCHHCTYCGIRVSSNMYRVL